MAKTIQDLQADLAHFRAAKEGTSAPAATATTSSPAVSAPAAPVSGIDADLAQYRAQREAGTLPRADIPKDDPNALAQFAKGLFSAPATIVARPFQAAAAIAGASNQQIDEFTHKIPVVGGLIADTPNTAADVKKDVGRAAQTVALGTGAPIAGGALFGAGASLEQGNDLLSAQTAVDAALGGAGGKVLDWVGKPILNAAGKAVGVITPKIIKDTAAKGAGAIAKFAEDHQLLGGVAAKPSAAIASGLQGVDDAIGKGIRKGGAALKNTAAEQFPDLNPVEHFKNVNAQDIARPTTVNEPRYSKATAIFNDAKARGIDLDQVANERGIIHDKVAEGGKYNTSDTVDNLREGNYKASDAIARPAIKAAEPGVARVPIKEVRNAMLAKVDSIPASQIDAEDRAALVNQISKRYSDTSAAAKAHPDGYSLTDLHDARIVSAKNGKYKPGADPSSALAAQRSREEGRVFADIFDQTVPAELGMKAFRRELEKNFQLADYLESLHGKSVPAGVTKKAVRLFGRATGAIVGGKLGGFSGSIFGSSAGDFLFKTFDTMSNPLKMRVLESLAVENPKAFQELIAYIGKEEAARLMRPLLGPAGSSSFKEAASTLFTTPKGKTSAIKGEAFDVAAVEKGKAKPPKTDRRLKSYLDAVKLAQGADGVYADPKDLPTIKMGPKKKSPKRLNDIL